jgi:hypothetical protein
MKDQYHSLAVAQLLAVAAYDADNTPAAVDLKGFESATIELAIGAGGITFTSSNKIEFVLTHSDDDSSYTNVASADMLGGLTVTSGIIKSLVAAHAAATVEKFGYVGGKRYLKLLADFSGTHGTATPLAACVIKGDPHIGQ